jgi:radical SAM superfamily enzyme YgiQ (UPF0313 family)
MNQSLKVPPLGLAYISSILKKNFIETKIIDLNIENLDLRKYFSENMPDVIGISSVVTNANQALQISKQAKSILPESFVVMGGPYVSIMKKNLLIRHREVDAVIVGEGEYSFHALIKNFVNKKFNSISGLIFKEKNEIKTNRQSAPIFSLDKIPFPAREELKMRLYRENAGVIFTSRGCPQQCIFCSRPVFGKKWRGHSPNYVLKEIRELKNNYGINVVSVLDDNFTFNIKRAEKILDKIIAKKWNLQIYFWNGLRADHITKNFATKLKSAGCVAINFGVESVDPNVLSFIRKGVKFSQIKKAIKITKNAGIHANAFLMIGNPGDKPQTADKIINTIKKVHFDSVHLSMATPIPGTPFWNWVQRNGKWLNFDTEELLDWPVDDIGETYPVFETEDFSAKQRIKAYEKVRAFLIEKNLIL